MTNYKKEINKMKKHRGKYPPAIQEVLSNHTDIQKTGVSAEISSSPNIFVILELIDIGMLAPEAFTVSMDRSSIKAVFQNKLYPLTSLGYNFLQETLKTKRKHIIQRVDISILVILIIIIICIVFYSVMIL